MSPLKLSVLLLCLTVFLPYAVPQVPLQTMLRFVGNEAGIEQEVAKWHSLGLMKRNTKTIETLAALSSRLNNLHQIWRGNNFTQDLLLKLQQSTHGNVRCAIDVMRLILDIEKGEPYTALVLDAFGKVPSGLSLGQYIWLGSYDVCKSITVYTKKNGDITEEVTDKLRFSGQYCFLELNSVAADPAFFLFLGTCMPNTCRNEDLKSIVDIMLKPAPNDSSAVKPGHVLCAVPAPWTGGDTAAIVVISIIVFLALAGSTYDIVRRMQRNRVPKDSYNVSVLDGGGTEMKIQNVVLTSSKTDLFSNDVLSHANGHVHGTIENISCSVQAVSGFMHQFLISFSLITNSEKLMSTRVREGQLWAVNGIRFISMSWIILGHTYSSEILFMSNILGALKFLNRFTFQAISNATFSVDSFFFLSGLLVAYLLLRELLKTGGRTNWAMLYFHRFWRLTPVFMFLLMVHITLFNHAVEGPFMRLFDQETENCKKHWWANLLYINNFVQVALEEECFGWSWYLANDMQFFIVSPVIIYLLYRNRYVGLSVIGVLLVGCITGNGVATRLKYSPKHLYVHPWFRISPYLVGIITAYLLHMWERHHRPRIHKGIVAVGWCAAFATNMSVLYGLYQPLESYEPLSDEVAALYQALSRFAWSVGLAWVAFACVTGNGGPVNTLLSWRVWAPLGRLTYCAYLVHPMVQFFFNLSLRQLRYATDYNMMYLFLANMVLSYAAAFIVSLLVEAPMMGLEKLFFHRKKE